MNSRFHPNLKPQDGYGITFEYKGAQKESSGSVRRIYGFGLSRTRHGYAEDGLTYYHEVVFLEINQIEDQVYYGFVGGLHLDGQLFAAGIFLNYMTDFSTKRALTLRPRLGISFYHWLSLSGFVEYDIYPLKANFDFVDHWLFGLQYNIGILQF